MDVYNCGIGIVAWIGLIYATVQLWQNIPVIFRVAEPKNEEEDDDEQGYN